MDPTRARRTIELPPEVVRVEAPQGLVFQVVAAGGEEIERRGEGERIVRFVTLSGRRRVESVERVLLHPPERIDYLWIEGPLPFVEESIEFAATPDGATEMRYSGRFVPAGGPLVRLVAGPLIRRRFARAVREHLAEGRAAAERRAARSHVFPPER